MLRDVVTIVILLASIGTVRSDDIERSISTECLEKIADVDTSVVCRGIGVGIAIGFHGYRRQGEQLIVAVINGICRVALGIKSDQFKIQRVLWRR